MKKFVVFDRLKKTAEVIKAYIDSATLKVTEAVLKSLNDVQNKLLPSSGNPGQVLTKKSITDYDVEWGGYITNPNLLINSYFIGEQFPINQIGKTEYVGPGYSIDMLYIQGEGKIEIVNEGLKLYPGWYRKYIEYSKDLLGKTVTFSALTTNNSLITITGKLPTQVSTSANLIPFSGNNEIQLGIYCYDATKNQYMATPVIYCLKETILQAIKLELGSIQTLAHKEGDVWVLNDPPPDYTVELNKCKNYLYCEGFGADGNIGTSASVTSPFIFDGEKYVSVIHLPIVMRCNPSVKIYSYDATENNVWISGHGNVPLTSVVGKPHCVILTGTNSQLNNKIASFAIIADSRL